MSDKESHGIEIRAENEGFARMLDAQDFGAVFSLPWCPTCQRMRFGTACVECGLPLEIGRFVPLENARTRAGDAFTEGYEKHKAESRGR